MKNYDIIKIIVLLICEVYKMAIIEYITGTLIAPNLAGYLINNSLTKIEEKTLSQNIKDILLKFNVKYIDTEIDSDYFKDYINQIKLDEVIYGKVFMLYKIEKDSYDCVIKQLVDNAAFYMHTKKPLENNLELKRKLTIEDFFKGLFEAMVDIRVSILGIKEKAMVATMVDALKQTNKDINSNVEMAKNAIIDVKENIDNALGDNYSLDVQIAEIKKMVDKGEYTEVENNISNVFELQTSISKKQRVELIFQRVRCYVNKGEWDQISALRNKIEHLDSNSTYIDYIDYYVAFRNNDSVGIQSSISNMRNKGVEQYKLDLLQTGFYIEKSMYDEALNVLLNEAGDLKAQYKDKDEANSQLGIIYLDQGQFRLAKKYLNLALEIRYTINYDYNYNTAEIMSFMEKIKNVYVINQEMTNEARLLLGNLKRMESFVRNCNFTLRLQHWRNYCMLIGICDIENLDISINKLEPDVANHESIAIVCGECFYLQKEYVKAIPYLEKTWALNEVFLMRLCDSYKRSNKLQELEELFKVIPNDMYDKEGIIFSFKIELLIKNGNSTEAIELIKRSKDRYANSPYFINKVLEIAYEYNEYDVYEEYILHLKEYGQEFDIDDKITISRVLYKQGKQIEVRQLLENIYLDNNDALELYLASYGEVNSSDSLFNEFKNIVLSTYDKGYRVRYLLICKFNIEFNMERYGDAIHTLEEYKEGEGEDSFYCVNIIQCVTLGRLEKDVSNQAEELIKMNILRYHIVVAQYYAYICRWDKAKEILLSSFYRYSDQIGEEEISAFVIIHLNNIQHESDEVEYKQVKDNSTVLLKSCDGKFIRYAIHDSKCMLQRNEETKFECINIKNTCDDGLILKANGRVGGKIVFKGKEYTVVEIVSFDTYLFRYCMAKLEIKYPDNKSIIRISSDTPEGLVKEMRRFLQDDNKGTKAKLDYYNFGTNTGTPLMYLSGKNIDRYLETIYYLLNDKVQPFFSVSSCSIREGNKYVLTSSSLVILNALGYLDRLDEIANRIYVVSDLKNLIRTGITEAIKYADTVVSTAFLDADTKFRMSEVTDEIKNFKKNFWSQILVALSKFNEQKDTVFDPEIYDILHEIVDISEFEAMETARTNEMIFVCDDLFISKINNGLSNHGQAVNAVGLLFTEKLISIEELIKVIKDLTEKRVVNCINHSMLFDIYCDLISTDQQDAFEKKFKDVKQIFDNMLNTEVRGYYITVYEAFRDQVIANGKMNIVLYELVREGLGLKPVNQLIVEAANNVGIKINEE